MDNILEKIYKSVLKFLEPLTPEKTYEIVVEEAVKLVNGSSGSIILQKANLLERVYSSKPEVHKFQPRKKGFAYTAFTKHQAFVVAQKALNKIHPEASYEEVESALFVPLSYRKKSIGVLVVRAFMNTQFTEKELEVLKIYGSFASLVIRKAQLYDETQKALQARDQFISLAAHELRTPLTAVSGYTQLLHSRFRKTDTTEARWVDQLFKESIRLANLINQFIEINRLNAGKMQYIWAECNIGEILRKSIEEFSRTYPERAVKFKNGLRSFKNSVVIGDVEKLKLVFFNLLDNAAKFSRDDSAIVLQFKSRKPFTIIQIIDQGEGIDKKELERVFQSFYKGELAHKQGLGMGLYLVKEIIDHHKGDIKISSKKGKGTKVEVFLPQVKR